MRYQLRDYTIKAGEMDQWIEEWRSKIVPLRGRFGFEVVGAWKSVDGGRFLWIIRQTGEGAWAEADSAYYNSSERKRIVPDPARHIAHSETSFMEAVVDP